MKLYEIDQIFEKGYKILFQSDAWNLESTFSL